MHKIPLTKKELEKIKRKISENQKKWNASKSKDIYDEEQTIKKRRRKFL